ncbi:TetR/AcrR family transcriptional regulator [Pseudolabrys sp. Root1462]|jgi:AcrR family transcriptional regulator|uniref:TetR/AcrR family transcriptional regulator n=1 Tax=Pseudolabrys sp. Root1462 TaxID=1736466 RepID=UPI000AB8C2BE|nr:TetR/AcrR family transcriptional regulator [Pseudolabrys sp. Root1462]
MLRKVPKQSRSEEMVSCILAGATRVLRRTPLASTTTNHIAEVAGVSVGSVYQYFDSKETIATTLFRRHLADSAQLLRRVRTESRGYSAEKRLRMPFVELLRDHRSDIMLHQNLMGVMETSRPTAETQSLIREITNEIAAVLGEEFPAIDQDEIKLCAALRQRYSVTLVHSSMIDPTLDRDGVVLDHFDSLSKANIKALGARARSRRRARVS